jgi:hypothetical protein
MKPSLVQHNWRCTMGFFESLDCFFSGHNWKETRLNSCGDLDLTCTRCNKREGRMGDHRLYTYKKDEGWTTVTKCHGCGYHSEDVDMDMGDD